MPEPSTNSTPTSVIWYKRLKRLLRFALFAGLIGLLVLIAVWWSFVRYLQNEDRKVFHEVELLNGGTIAFDQADFSLFKTFPAASFTLNNIEIRDKSYVHHERSLVQLEQLRIHLSFKNWWQNPLQETLLEIDTIELRNGRIYLFKDSTGYSNLQALIKGKVAPDSEKEAYKLKVETKNTAVRLSAIELELNDAIKDSHIHGTIDTLQSILNIRDGDLDAQTDFVILTEQVTFNKEKGVYAPNSRLQGKCLVEYENGKFEIQPFDLAINDQCFEFSILTKIREGDASVITFENAHTDLFAARPLLPHSIENQIKNYQILQPFYSKTTIETAFKANDHPIVTVDFVLNHHDVVVGEFSYSDVNVQGKFVNRMYADERANDEPRNTWRLEFANVAGRYQGFRMTTDSALVTKNENNEIDLKTAIKVAGKAAEISEWLENDQFFFRKGRFELYADVNGSLKDYDQLVISTAATLKMREFGVYYEPANVTFPFESLMLKKASGDANFKIIGSTIERQNRYQADGGVENFPALILETVDGRTKSEVQLYASKINWTDFVNLFGENGYLMTPTTQPIAKNDRQKKASLKQTLRGLQYDFQPAMSIVVDTLEYYDALKLYDFKTGVHFEDENTLVLEKTSFQYLDGQVDVSAKLDISQLQSTPFEFSLHVDKLNVQQMLPSLNYLNNSLLKEIEALPESVTVDIKHRGVLDDEKGLVPNSSQGEITFSMEGGEELQGKITYESSLYFAPEKTNLKRITRTQINLEGAPRLFNEFFKAEQFFFQNGRFKTQVNYEGDIYDLNQLLAEAKVDLSMTSSEIYYAPGAVTFPIPQLDLIVKRDSAAFVFQVASDSLNYPVNFIGNIQPLSELLVGDTGQPINTKVDVHSSKLKWDNIRQLLTNTTTNPEQDSTTQDKETPKQKNKDIVKTPSAKSTIKNILLKFHPQASLRIDTLIYSDNISIQQLQSELSLSDANELIVENTGFQFQDGNVQLYGKFDFSQTTHTPFSTEFVTDDLNIGKLLKGFNYLSLPSLQSIEELKGDINLDLHFSGSINQDGTALITEDNKGLLRFNLRNLQVIGFEPLEELAAKVFMKKRFANLRFAPIVNTFRIQGDKLFFPLTEIQSTAFNLFIEGQLSYGDDTNIWASLPLSEILFNDPDNLPKKTGYHMRPLKLHAEVTSDENGENQFKLRWSKKNFYEQRGILEQYKRDRELARLKRKEARKAKRKN